MAKCTKCNAEIKEIKNKDNQIESFDITSGAQFSVLIYREKVFKIPKMKITNEELKKLVYHQNKLSVLDGIPKAEYANGVIVEDYVPGETIGHLKKYNLITEEEKEEIDRLKKELTSKINDLGYSLRDRNVYNVLYDKENGNIYFVDFIDLYKVNEKNPRKKIWRE